MTKQKAQSVEFDRNKVSDPNVLILFNDDVNTFDFVIDSLIEVCDHEPEQAEQCALIAHFKGKCDVKNGPLPDLKPRHDEMTRRGLTVKID
jgi:ATP-dependent Clp protease adaptor protein ClpS